MINQTYHHSCYNSEADSRGVCWLILWVIYEREIHKASDYLSSSYCKAELLMSITGFCHSDLTLMRMGIYVRGHGVLQGPVGP